MKNEILMGAASVLAGREGAEGVELVDVRFDRPVVVPAGASATLQIALDLVRPAGWISKVGWGPQPLGFNLDPLVQKNVTLQGSFSHHWTIWERVIALLADGQFDVKPIIGGIWPIEEWHEAFEKMHSGEVVKSVLAPTS